MNPFEWYDINGEEVEIEDMVPGHTYYNEEGVGGEFSRDAEGNGQIHDPQQIAEPQYQNQEVVPTEDVWDSYTTENRETPNYYYEEDTPTELGLPALVGIVVGSIAVLTILIVTGVKTLFTIQTQAAGIVERFGRFKRIAKPGLNVKIPYVDRVSDVLSLRVQEFFAKIETKTKDDVTLALVVSVQYRVDSNNDGTIYKAAYELSDVEKQLRAYVYDSVRSIVPTMTLDESFASKDVIANHVQDELKATMEEYGYTIEKALVTDIVPAEAVLDAMNEINAQQRLAVAAEAKAKAERILIVGAAEGEAQAKKLSGEGIANMRKAIADGLAAQHETLEGAGIKGADQVLMLNQYMDMMSQVAHASKTNTVFLSGSPSGLTNLSDEIRNSVFTANVSSEAGK